MKIRMKNKFLNIFFLLTILCACDKDSDEISDVITIEGTVQTNSSVIPNATVIIDSKINWSTKTDENGYFKIEDVTKGEHQLMISKNFDEGSFIEKSYEINSAVDIVLNILTLPNPVSLNEPEINLNSIKLNWNSSQADDFREYKVYRKTDSGLDETTGELVHVSTVRNDTVFVDNDLLFDQEYFYRVYVMNDLGRLGGSNLIKTSTQEGELITFGNFEDHLILDLIEHSNGNGTITLDEAIMYSGTKSLYYNNNTGSQISAWVNKKIYLKPNTSYKFSCWYKGKGSGGDSGYWHFRLELTKEASGVTLNDLRVPDDNIGSDGYREDDWTFITTTVYNGENTDPYFLYIRTELEDLWLDDLELVEL